MWVIAVGVGRSLATPAPVVVSGVGSSTRGPWRDAVRGPRGASCGTCLTGVQQGGRGQETKGAGHAPRRSSLQKQAAARMTLVAAVPQCPRSPGTCSEVGHRLPRATASAARDPLSASHRVQVRQSAVQGRRNERKKKKTSPSRAHKRLFSLEGGHTLGLLLVTQLKVLAPGQRLVRLVFADGALEAEDHLLGGLGLRGGSTGMKRHTRGNRRQGRDEHSHACASQYERTSATKGAETTGNVNNCASTLKGMPPLPPIIADYRSGAPRAACPRATNGERPGGPQPHVPP